MKPLSKDKLPSAELFREAIDYNPVTGVAIWRERPLHHFASQAHCNAQNRRQAGTVVGSKRKNGTLSMMLFGRMHYVHRVAWLISTDDWPKEQIDHINGDNSDNRLSNLREATHAQNIQNSNRKPGVSGVRGVIWEKTSGKWSVRIKKDRKLHSLGSFSCLKEAEKVRIEAEHRFFGEFAVSKRPAP